MIMERTDFEQQLNALVPQPDPADTAALFSFGQELSQDGECEGMQELLDSMSFVSRHFSAATAQGVYEIIRHGSAALPSEMVAAAVYLENGSTPQAVAEMADAGSLMCFHQPESAEEASPLAVCTLIEKSVPHEFHTLHFGGFDPDTALRSAQWYAHNQQISVTDALLVLTTDMALDPSGGTGKILVGSDPEMTQALFSVFHCCPAVAARLTFDADCGQTSVEYNPLWLELRQQQEAAQCEMAQTL